MELNTQTCCGICYNILCSAKRTMILEIKDLLSFLIGKVVVVVNYKLLQDSVICDTCLTKIQSACSFKTTYLETSCKIKIEEKCCDKQLTCVICHNIVPPIDCIPLVDSVNKTQVKYLSSELELNIPNNSQTCETCYKSLLSFFTTVNLLSIFDQENTGAIELDTKDFQQIDIESNIIKDEIDSIIQDVKEEVEDANKYDNCLNEEIRVNTKYEEFVMKNEEIDLKMEEDLQRELNNQNLRSKTIQQKDSQKFQCDLCDFHTKHRNNLKQHSIVHKNSNDIDMFQCNICAFKTKYKNSLRKHVITHKNSEKTDMFMCHICKYQTKRKDHLRKHVQIHNNSNKVDMFLHCNACDFQTKHTFRFKEHLATHTTS